MAAIFITDVSKILIHSPKCFEMYYLAHTAVGDFGACDIAVGLDGTMVDKLIERSQDYTDQALNLTDDRGRFKDRVAYELWFQKGRIPFVLIHRGSNDLMALIWIGEKPFIGDASQDLWDTMAFRSYPPYRGGGFMTSFGQYVVQKYVEQNPTRRLWVSIDKENIASQALAKKLGFTAIDSGAGETRTVMVLMK